MKKYTLGPDAIVFTNKCRFDGTILGTITLPGELYKGKTITPEMLGIEDARCDHCKNLYGDYPEMSARFLDRGGTYGQFKKVMVKLGYKKDGFEEELDKIK